MGVEFTGSVSRIIGLVKYTLVSKGRHVTLSVIG